jgi:hypothetical protein
MTSIEDRGVPASRVSDEHRLHQAAHISAAWCGDELVLLDATTGQYFTLNHVAGRMWELLATPKSPEDLILYLRTAYDVPPAVRGATLRGDVARMIDNMLEAGLLVAENPASVPESSTSNWRRSR